MTESCNGHTNSLCFLFNGTVSFTHVSGCRDVGMHVFKYIYTQIVRFPFNEYVNTTENGSLLVMVNQGSTCKAPQHVLADGFRGFPIDERLVKI